MGKTVTQQLLEDHLLEGSLTPGEEIGIRIDQTLTQDATGTMVMLELESMGLDRAQTEVSVQYVDHNLVQNDFKNADDHLFLQSAAQRFGLWYSKAGNGVSHPVHMERFGIPGKTVLGSDSHTPAAGSLGMLAIGAGGLEVALAIAGQPFYLKMPKVMGIRLAGRLPDWVSAKDVILEMLRRFGVEGGIGWVLEYYGPGLDALSAMDRHVIANMGTELGATTTVFPSDQEVRRFLARQKRGHEWREILPDADAQYDEHVEMDLSMLEPLVALPSSPGNVVPVRDVAGKEIYQSMVGSSANPGFRDFAIAAQIVENRQVHERVSFDINPTSRQILEDLALSGDLMRLIHAGARIHQTGCNGCIGMGQAPATGKNSLRTVPRNFPGRSGTKEDAVFLCSPETAAASALTGVITDPRDLDVPCPRVEEPQEVSINTEMLQSPLKEHRHIPLEKGPNVRPLPHFPPLSDEMEGPVLMKVGNDLSTDEIMPAGSRVLPFRSNIPEISKFVFSQVDETYYARAMEYQDSGHFIVGGLNYGQGSSREHAAIAPRYLGVQAVIAKSYARIHWQNLINFGILPLTFQNRNDYDHIALNDNLSLTDVHASLEKGQVVMVHNTTKNETYPLTYTLSKRQIGILLKGGAINLFKHTH